MSDKKPKSFTLDKENAKMCDELDNASAVVNDLLTQYRQTGDRHTAAIDLEIEQKEREIEEKVGTVERLRQDVEELKQLKASFNEQEDAELQQAREELAETPKDPTNPAIQNWADKLGMTAQELVNTLQQ